MDESLNEGVKEIRMGGFPELRLDQHNTEAWLNKVETEKQSFDLVALSIISVLKGPSKEIGSEAKLQVQAVSRREGIRAEIVEEVFKKLAF